MEKEQLMILSLLEILLQEQRAAINIKKVDVFTSGWSIGEVFKV